MNAQPVVKDRVDGFQKFFLVLLRWAIGWHLCFEGWAKIKDPGWTAQPYLDAAHGPAAEFFRYLADNPDLLWWTDLANRWGLFLLGACLMLGLLTRLSGFLGFVLLGLYFLCNPPLVIWETGVIQVVGEGNYLFVDKVLIEAVALAVVSVFPTGRWIGLDAYIWPALRMRLVNSSPEEEVQAARMPVIVSPPTHVSDRRLTETISS